MSTTSSPESRSSSSDRLYCGGSEPVFLAALAFASGILAANYLWRSPFIWLAGFCLAIVGAGLSLRRSPQLAFVFGLLAVLPLGAFYLQARDAAQPAIVENLQFFEIGRAHV